MKEINTKKDGFKPRTIKLETFEEERVLREIANTSTNDRLEIARLIGISHLQVCEVLDALYNVLVLESNKEIE